MHVSESIARWPGLRDEGYLYGIYYEKTLSAEMAPRRRLLKQAAKNGNGRKQVDGVYRESQRGRVKQGRQLKSRKLQNETARPSGPNVEPCAAEALKSMTTTLPWMPTITQMVYLENGAGH